MQVFVRDNDVNSALRVLKKKMQREGTFREMKRRRAYEKPSERRVREKAEAIRGHRDGHRSSLGQLLRLTFVHSVRISADPQDHRHNDADDEHDRQEQHDFPSPGDWRDRNNGYPESDHAQANNRIIAAIDARLFAQPPKRSSMKMRSRPIFQHADPSFGSA